MRFKYQGTRITLRGVKDQLNACKAISGKHLQGLLNTGAVEQVIHLCHMAERPKRHTTDSATPDQQTQIAIQYPYYPATSQRI